MKKKKDDWFDEHIIVVGSDAKANKAVKAKIKEGGDYICNSCWDESKVNRHTRAGAEGKNIFCPHCRSVSKVYHFAWSALGCSHCKNCIDKTDWLIKEVA